MYFWLVFCVVKSFEESEEEEEEDEEEEDSAKNAIGREV